MNRSLLSHLLFHRPGSLLKEAGMHGIEVGLKGRFETVVHRHDLASVMGNIGAQVLSTHHVVLFMELAARNAIEGKLPEGMMTVGTTISIRHLSGAPMGVTVRAEACLREIEGRRLTFDVAVYDAFEKIAEGRNEQLIVSKDKFLSRIKRKVPCQRQDPLENSGTKGPVSS